MGISYKHFLYGAITFVSLLLALLKVSYSTSTGRGPMEFYVGILFLAFLVWAGGELWEIHKKEQEISGWTGREGGQPSLPEDSRPGEDALIAAETYLSMGENMDVVCMFVNANYRDWEPARKQQYRQGLRAVLDQRRANRPPEEQPGAGGLTSN